METDWYAYKTKGGETLFHYNVRTGEHRWKEGCFEVNDGNYVTRLSQYGSPWCEYKCKSGQTLFYFNEQTGEHKWELYTDSSLATIPREPVYLNSYDTNQDIDLQLDPNTDIGTYRKRTVSEDLQDNNANDSTAREIRDDIENNNGLISYHESHESLDNFESNVHLGTAATDIENADVPTSVDGCDGTSVADLISQELRTTVVNNSECMSLRTTLRTRNLNVTNCTPYNDETELSDEDSLSSASSSSGDDNCSNFSDQLSDLSESDSEEDEELLEYRNPKRKFNNRNGSVTNSSNTASQQSATTVPTLSVTRQPNIPSIPPPQLSPSYAVTYQEGNIQEQRNARSLQAPGGASHGFLSDFNSKKSQTATERHLPVHSPLVLSSSGDIVITSCFSLSQQGVQGIPISLNNKTASQPMDAQRRIIPMQNAGQQQGPSIQSPSVEVNRSTNGQTSTSSRSIQLGNFIYPFGQIVRKALLTTLQNKQTTQNTNSFLSTNNSIQAESEPQNINTTQPLPQRLPTCSNTSLGNTQRLIHPDQSRSDSSSLSPNNSSLENVPKNIHPSGSEVHKTQMLQFIYRAQSLPHSLSSLPDNTSPSVASNPSTVTQKQVVPKTSSSLVSPRTDNDLSNVKRFVQTASPSETVHNDPQDLAMDSYNSTSSVVEHINSYVTYLDNSSSAPPPVIIKKEIHSPHKGQRLGDSDMKVDPALASSYEVNSQTGAFDKINTGGSDEVHPYNQLPYEKPAYNSAALMEEENYCDGGNQENIVAAPEKPLQISMESQYSTSAKALQNRSVDMNITTSISSNQTAVVSEYDDIVMQSVDLPDNLEVIPSLGVDLESPNDQCESSSISSLEPGQITVNSKEMGNNANINFDSNNSVSSNSNLNNDGDNNNNSSKSSCYANVANKKPRKFSFVYTIRSLLPYIKVDDGCEARSTLSIDSSNSIDTCSPAPNSASSLFSSGTAPTMVTLSIDGSNSIDTCSPAPNSASSLFSSSPTMVTDLVDVTVASKTSLLTLAHIQSHQAGDTFVDDEISRNKTKKVGIFDRTVECYYCRRGFQSANELQRHLVLRHCHLGGMFKCDTCNDSFYSKEEFTYHVALHGNETTVVCKRCKQNYETVDLLAEHMSSHLIDSKKDSAGDNSQDQGERIEEDNVVENSSQSVETPVGHRYRTRQSCREQEEDAASSGNDNNESLKSDHTSSHQNESKENPNRDQGGKSGHDNDGESSKEGDTKRRECNHCDQKFNHFFAWRLHMKTHEEARIFSCKLCTNWYLSIRSLSQHVVTHLREKKAKCNVCAIVFRTYKDFLQHQKDANCKFRLFRCVKKKCRHVFYNWEVYQKHMVSVHANTFRCETCGKSFARSGKLKDHVLLHTGDKPKGCDICGRHFRTKTLLKNHRKTHSIDKPLKCKVCEKGFKQKSALLRHERSHIQNVRDHCCTICGKIFTQSCSLQRHHRIHTGERFKCPECPMKYIEAWRMRTHIKKKHPNAGMSES